MIMPEESEEMSAQKKAAILMLALGEDAAADIMKNLSESEVQDLAQTLAELGTVTSEQEDEVLVEFEQLLSAGEFVSEGGLDFARGALEKALGPKGAQSILDRVSTKTSSGFYLLRNVDPKQMGPYVAKEHPQTVALILSQMDPDKAADVFSGLPEEMQADVAYRLTKMGTITPEALRELEESLARDLETMLSGQVTEIGGAKAVAEILNRTGQTTEAGVLEHLDTLDPDVAEEVRNLMFTFDNIAELTDGEIRKVLQVVDNKEWAIALKGASQEMVDRVFANLSQGASQTLKEEMEYAGPVRRSEVEDVQKRIVQAVRQMEEAGDVTAIRGDSGDVYM